MVCATWSGENKQYLDRIRELEALVSAVADAWEQAQAADGSSVEPRLDLYRHINVAMEAGIYGKLSQPGVGGSPTAPGHYVLALHPVIELLEGVSTKAQSAMDVEVRQVLSYAVSEMLVVAKAYDPKFP